MHHHYSDIRELIPAEPRWFDEYAVPRYVDFHPTKLANIYAREAVLAEIACQHCERLFRVAFSHFNHKGDISPAIVKNELDYGDPPNIECCPAGPPSSSVAKRVLEYWARANVKLPNIDGLLNRLKRDGPAVLRRSSEKWATDFADELATAAATVEQLRTVEPIKPAIPAHQEGQTWVRYSILEVPIYPSWMIKLG